MRSKNNTGTYLFVKEEILIQNSKRPAAHATGLLEFCTKLTRYSRMNEMLIKEKEGYPGYRQYPQILQIPSDTSGKP